MLWGSLAMTTGAAGRFLEQYREQRALRVPEQQQPEQQEQQHRFSGGVWSSHNFIPLHKAVQPLVGGACERGHVLARWPASSNADRRVCLATRSLSAEAQ